MARTRIQERAGVGRASLAALATCLVMSAAGCAGDEAPEAAPSEASPSPSATTASEPASPEVGTWETDPISRADFVKTLRQAGFGKHVHAFETREDWLPQKHTVLSLELLDGRWTLYGALDERPPAVVDQQSYEVDGDRFVITSGVGQTVFTSTVGDEELALSFVSSTEPDYQGVPVEAVLRLYYTTAPFHRVDS